MDECDAVPRGADRDPRLPTIVSAEDVEVILKERQESLDRFTALVRDVLQVPTAVVSIVPARIPPGASPAATVNSSADGSTGQVASHNVPVGDYEVPSEPETAPARSSELVDHLGQYFPGASGLPEPWQTWRATPLVFSVCLLVVQAQAPIVVEDARTDERTRDNPAITAMDLIAYLGVPVSDGTRIVGALCAIDNKPRQWSERDLRVLSGLAEACSAELSLHGRHARAQARQHEAESLRYQAEQEQRHARTAQQHSEQRSRTSQQSERHSRLLLALSEALTATTTVNSVIQAVHDIAVAYLDAQDATFDLPHPSPGGSSQTNGVDETGRAEGTDRAGRGGRGDGEGVVRVPLSGSLRGHLVLTWTTPGLAQVWTGPSTPDATFSQVQTGQTLTALAHYASTALDRAMLLQERRSAAATLQHAMLTTLPHRNDLELVARYVPAAAVNQVGGDWYDALTIPAQPIAALNRPGPDPVPTAGDFDQSGNSGVLTSVMSRPSELPEPSTAGAPRTAARAATIQALARATSTTSTIDDAFRPSSGAHELQDTSAESLALVIGDVAGHDIQAAAAMGQIRSVLRGLLADSPWPPAQMIERLDTVLARLHIPAAATLLLATVHPHRRVRGAWHLRWASAGHPQPGHLDRSGQPSVLHRIPDLLLGIPYRLPRTTHHTDLLPGDTLLLYTDGLIERPGQLLSVGQRHLMDSAARHHHLPLEQLLDNVLRDLVPTAPSDDCAILGLRLPA